jgi:hypothetical protein
MAMEIDHIPMHVKRIFLTAEESACRGQFVLSKAAINAVEEYGLAWKYHNAELVHDVLQTPLSVWRGLSRDNFENGFCYAGRPEYSLDEEGEEIAMPGDRLFLAFVKCHHNSLVVFDWEFRRCETDDCNIPINAATDFEEKIWSLTARKTR